MVDAIVERLNEALRGDPDPLTCDAIALPFLTFEAGIAEWDAGLSEAEHRARIQEARRRQSDHRTCVPEVRRLPTWRRLLDLVWPRGED